MTLSFYEFNGSNFRRMEAASSEGVFRWLLQPSDDVDGWYNEHGFVRQRILDESWDEVVFMYFNVETGAWIFTLSPDFAHCYDVICANQVVALQFWSKYLTPLLTAYTLKMPRETL